MKGPATFNGAEINQRFYGICILSIRNENDIGKHGECGGWGKGTQNLIKH